MGRRVKYAFWGLVALAARANVVFVAIITFTLSLASAWADFFDWKLASASLQSATSVFGLVTLSSLWGKLKFRTRALSTAQTSKPFRESFLASVGAKNSPNGVQISLDQTFAKYGNLIGAARKIKSGRDHDRVAMINAVAYLHTEFGLFAFMKETRNRRLHRKNPICFLLSSTDCKKPVNVVTCVVPMTSAMYSSYLRSGRSDNDFNAGFVAGRDVPADVAHIFFLAIDPDPIERAVQCSFDEAVLVLALLQIACIAPSPAKGIRAVLAADNDMEALLSTLGFSDTGDVNADGLAMWSGHISFSWSESAVDQWLINAKTENS